MSLSSDEFEKSKRAFDELKASMAQGVKIQKDMEKGLTSYSKALINIAEQQKNILHLEQQLANETAKVEKMKKDIATKEAANRDKIERWQKLYETGSERTRAIAEKHLNILNAQTAELKTQLEIEEGLLKASRNYLEVQKKNLEVAKQSAKEASLLLATMKSLTKLPGLGKKWGFDKMKSWGLFEMDKELRNAARSMNVGAKDFKSFSNDINKAGESTVKWGVNTKDLAKMQQGYSEAIGRSVMLTEDGNKAMALMAEGTGLGAEFAVQMATEMDKFGASVETSKDLVAATIKQAGRLGVNGAAASKKLVSLLKLSQTYVFKGGQKALDKMAADAERLKLDLEGAAGMAEKVMRPEGAVETAALLTTMGGEFAKLGDPFQLMFKARNDFAGFAKDLGKASAEFVEYNEQTKSFDIKGGLARDRMLEISKITGIQMDKLQEMAVAEKKLQMVQANAPSGIVSEEDKALVASLTQIGKNGELMIKMPGKDPFSIDKLNASMLKEYKQKQQDLEKAAEQSRTFDEVVTDLIMSLKQTLLPFVQELKDGFGKRIQNLIEEWKQNGFYQSLKDFAKLAGKLASSIGKFIIENPITSLILWKGFDIATWIANGVALGKGFMMTAGGMGAMGRGASGVAAGGTGFMGMGGSAMSRGAATLNRFGGNKTMARLAGGTSRFAAGSMGSVVGGAGLGLAGMGLNALRGDENSAAYNSSTGKALGVGSSALAGAGMGMMFGPWGALIGGLLGAGKGVYDEYMTTQTEVPVYNDALVASNGKNNGGPGTIVKFNPHDKFLSVNDALIAGTNAGANNKLYDQLTGKEKSKKGGSGSKINGTYTHIVEIKGIQNADAFAKMIVDAVINDPSNTRKVNIATKKSQSADINYGKTTGKPKSPLKGTNSR